MHFRRSLDNLFNFFSYRRNTVGDDVVACFRLRSFRALLVVHFSFIAARVNECFFLRNHHFAVVLFCRASPTACIRQTNKQTENFAANCKF